jgi:uncharacterized membrane protein YfcA
MADAWPFLVLPAAGFLVGIIASMTGVGGGIIIVPLLTILFGFVPQHAVGTSLGSIIFTALASSFSYAQQRRIYFRTGLWLTVMSVPGAYIGAYLTTIISSRHLGLIFGVFMLFVSLRMMLKIRWGGRPMRTAEAAAAYAPNSRVPVPEKTDAELVRLTGLLIPGVGLSFFAGVASGFLGIGGGVLGVPILNLVMHLPIHFATATSMFTMIFTSVSGAAKHALAHHVHWSQALLLALGTIFGAQVGASFSRRVSGAALSLIFGAVLLLISLQMILKFL